MSLWYTGTLKQWQAMLHRKAVLPDALGAVNFTKTPEWTLANPRFASSVPSSVLALTAMSPLTLTTAFIHDGERTRWDVQEANVANSGLQSSSFVGPAALSLLLLSLDRLQGN